MATMTTLLNTAEDGPNTAERKLTAEQQLRRNLAITDSARERIRTKLIDTTIEDSPVKRDRGRTKGQDEELLSKIRGSSPASSEDSVSATGGERPISLLNKRLLSSRQHRKSPSGSAYAFPNEYSIPTLPIPSSPSIHTDLKPPESPPRFRKRETTVDGTPTKSPREQTPREPSVRFSLPPEDDTDEDLETANRQHYPLTSTPLSSRTRQLLDDQADSFDSAKSYIEAYSQSPNRFRRQQTPTPTHDTPSKLLRTLSRATSTPASTIPPPSLDSSVFHTPAGDITQESLNLSDAEKTLDSIIESAEDASIRIRKVLDKSRQERENRQSVSPGRSEDEDEQGREVSVWGEKSFFRRMARRAPGGWAFTPQPKYRTSAIQEDAPVKEEKVGNTSGTKWWNIWPGRRKQSERETFAKEEVKKEDTPPSPIPIPKTETISRSSSKDIPLEIVPAPSLQPKDVPLSALSEKRLRLARSLQLLQSDIRLAREGIETLENRLERISLASSARQIDSDRRVTLRRERGEPPPLIPHPLSQPVTSELPRGGTYLWLPFQKGWIIWILWLLLVVQGWVIWAFTSKSIESRWEPYSFGDWGRDVKWPT